MDRLYQEALTRFRELSNRAHASSIREPAAAALATADVNAAPSVRTVLVRDFDERGFVFYTNSQSRKGRELAANPQASLCFYWDPIAEQVRIDGQVEIVSAEENETYWRRRPRERQLGAWVSNQSQKLESATLLAEHYAELERRFADTDVPRPEHWFGFRLVPDRIEFWSNRPARLHERIVYERDGVNWVTYLLYP
jgi:pyridoxamine 5'-phosphate oxidase